MATLPQKIDLTGLDRDNLSRHLIQFGMRPFRGDQVFQWIHQQGQVCFEEMSNLSKKDRQILTERALVRLPSVRHHQKARDGAEKFLFELSDGHTVEGVLIPEENRMTLCTSTQVGCAMACAFCQTGQSGWVRDLTASEMVGQLLRVRSLQPADRPLTHLVIMGMGEPLANYENVLLAVRILLDPQGVNMSRRKVTLSTCGLIPGIERLGREQIGINLAVSLNAADTETRDRLMPINRRYPMKALLKTIQDYPLPPRSRITFEYVLIAGVNDSVKDAGQLTEILRGIPCKINLIPMNPIPGCSFKSPKESEIEAFQSVLLRARYTAVIRESRGAEIAAACGQLREQASSPNGGNE